MSALHSPNTPPRKGKAWFVGFFAAIHSGPDAIPRNTWLVPVVQRRGRIDDWIPTLTALFDDVGRRLETGDASLWPSPDDVEGVAKFCEGYEVGAELHASWPFGTDTDPEGEEPTTIIRFVFAALAGEVPDAKLRSPWEPPMTKEEADAWRRDRRNHLPQLITLIFERFAEARGARRQP
jgi:hypothetical protein